MKTRKYQVRAILDPRTSILYVTEKTIRQVVSDFLKEVSLKLSIPALTPKDITSARQIDETVDGYKLRFHDSAKKRKSMRISSDLQPFYIRLPEVIHTTEK